PPSTATSATATARPASSTATAASCLWCRTAAVALLRRTELAERGGNSPTTATRARQYAGRHATGADARRVLREERAARAPENLRFDARREVARRDLHLGALHAEIVDEVRGLLRAPLVVRNHVRVRRFRLPALDQPLGLRDEIVEERFPMVGEVLHAEQ